MMTDQSPAPFAAAVYRPDTGDRMALLKFVEQLRSEQVRVGGLLQEALFDSAGEISGLNAIDALTGQRLPITRPMESGGECAFDVSALADTTAIIRNAIGDPVDLMVVEKFGELEQDGKGLIDEIFQTISAGIPLLISVPKAALPLWQERSGELGSVVDFNLESFLQWWHNLQSD